MKRYSRIERYAKDGTPIYYGWFESMHTRMDILLYDVDRGRGDDMMNHIYEQVDLLYHSLDRFDPQSEISLINNDSLRIEFQPSDTIMPLFVGAMRYYELTMGAFDITIQTPEQDRDNQPFSIDRDTLRKSSPAVIFDFGGYAKGYALDMVIRVLKESGVGNALISFGNSSVYGLGCSASGQPWAIAVDNPFANGGSVYNTALSNQAMSTSGNSNSHTAHILSKVDSSASTARKLICVRSCSALDSEVCSTALFAANDELLRKKIMEAICIDDAVEICFNDSGYETYKIN